MQADAAHGLVAELLISPVRLKNMLESKCENSSLRGRAGSDPAFGENEMDKEQLRQLQLFQGFIARVRHNPIIPLMPRTFAALKALHAEIRFFSLHAQRYMQAREGGRLTLHEQVGLLAQSIARHDEQIGCKGLAIIAQHEMMMFHARSKAWHCRNSSLDKTFDPDVGLTLGGELLFAHYRSDIVAALTYVDKGQLERLSEPNDVERHVAYWHEDSTATSNYIVLDDLTLHLLRQVDGRRSAREIHLAFSALLGRHLDEQVFYDFFRSLRRLSVIL